MNNSSRNLLTAFILGTASLAMCQGVYAPVRVKDLPPTSRSQGFFVVTSATPQRLYFRNETLKETQQPYYQLWSSNGSEAGTTMFTETPNYLYPFASSISHLFYMVNSGITEETNEVRFIDLANGSLGGLNNSLRAASGGAQTVLGSKLIVAGKLPGASVRDICYVEPPSTTAVLLRKIRTSGDPEPKYFNRVGDKVYFSANNGTQGAELWVTDGTPVNTVMMKDIFAGAAGSEPQELATCGTRLYFSALAKTTNREPWYSQGTTASTLLLKEINPSTSGGSDPREFVAVGTKTYFTADDGNGGRELWVTSGANASTAMVKNLNTEGGSDPHGLVAHNGLLYFFATPNTGMIDPMHLIDQPEALYSTDGTAAGTIKRKTLAAGMNGDQPISLDKMLFYVTRKTGASQLWRTTDGTVVDQVVPNLASNLNPIADGPMKTMGNWLYFSANFDGAGYDIYKAEGAYQGLLTK